MWPAAVADRLRGLGHDAESVLERSELRGRPDEEIFTVAQAEERVVFTENGRDYRPVARDWIHRGGVHHGLVLATNRSFARHRSPSIGRLITALERLFTDNLGSHASNREVWL